MIPGRFLGAKCTVMIWRKITIIRETCSANKWPKQSDDDDDVDCDQLDDRLVCGQKSAI